MDQRRRRCDRLAEHQNVSGDRRRAEIARLDGADPGHQRRRQARRLYRAGPAAGPRQGYARARGLLFRGDQSQRRRDLGIVHRLSERRRGAAGSRNQSARDGHRGNLLCPGRRSQGRDQGLFAARHGYRQQWRRLGVAGQRPFRQLRPAQMQGPAERAQGDGQSLSRRLDDVSLPRTAIPRTSRIPAARKPAITPGSISTTRSVWATTCPSPPAMRRMRCWR